MNKIVVRYLDGRIVKGTTQNFDPGQSWFHLIVEGRSGPPIQVALRELKAVFFVKQFEGNPSYDETKEFPAEGVRQGRRIQVQFNDGELLVGVTLNYDPTTPGFFMFPADPNSNNQRVYVINTSVVSVEQGDPATAH